MTQLLSAAIGFILGLITFYSGYRCGLRRLYKTATDDFYLEPVPGKKGKAEFVEPIAVDEAYRESKDIADFIKKTQKQDE